MTESGISDGFATLLEARWLLLKNAANLDPEKDEKARLKEALKLNEPLAVAYYLEEDQRRFWEQPGRRFAMVCSPKTGPPEMGVAR